MSVSSPAYSLSSLRFGRSLRPEAPPCISLNQVIQIALVQNPSEKYWQNGTESSSHIEFKFSSTCVDEILQFFDDILPTLALEEMFESAL